MDKILEVRNLKKSFNNRKVPFLAVDNVSFDVYQGECLGIVGKSGSGKSTIAKMLAHLLIPDAGTIFLNDIDITKLKGKEVIKIYKQLQMVFQYPQSSFDPRQTLANGIMESLKNQGMKKRERNEKLRKLLDLVELDQEFVYRYPHEVSGGQCQRAAIARALAIEPKLIIFDEATSALDVTVQAQIIKLLKKLSQEKKLSIIFICHDLALIQQLCHRTIVIDQGKVIEGGLTDDIIQKPQEECTKLLIDAIL